MPRFNAPAVKPGYGSGFDHVALRDTIDDFRTWWDRSCLLVHAPTIPSKESSMPMAA
ncbi:hypothetical protein [Alloyangia pacifica]|uniref:hypothetical protein n=1 Tax=Alloyangia pacifica TaxID=311180 RepID=UPI00131F10D8|nr:hypothetical protein [Alloyangia pacifica]